MKAAYCIHQIHYRNEKGEPAVAAAGSVQDFDFNDDDFAHLVEMEAIREPTEEEFALHDMTKPKPVEAVEPVVDAKVKAKADKAAEKAAEKAKADAEAAEKAKVDAEAAEKAKADDSDEDLMS